MTKRSYVRITSYIIFALVILIATTMVNTKNMTSYKNQLELSYQQSLAELSECLSEVNTDLTKSLYSNSSKELYNVSKDLYAQCATAKNAISRLPVSQMELSNTYRFLSQASDYAQYIADKIEKKEPISDKEHKNIYNLLGYAQKFSQSAEEMVSIVQAGGRITGNEVRGTDEVKFVSLSNSFTSSAKTFDDFPTLLYDGPFSDQVLNKKSAMVTNADVKTKDECKKIAADALNVGIQKISYETDEQANLPSYTFNCGRYTISVTKQGGYIKSIIYSGVINKSAIDEKTAVSAAKKYLDSIGFKDMGECYYSKSENICTINFAYAKDGIYCYSDQIKVGVSLEDGRILSLDSKTYLTNHIRRGKFAPKLTLDKAQAKLSKYLKVQSSKKCIIPKENGKEVSCYEFHCKSSETGEDTLIYINCDTGDEEDIMLLLYTDNGTLVK